ncbi:hypothetical protein BH09BAC6_BH09BAC6_36100 [soil metagenome]
MKNIAGLFYLVVFALMAPLTSFAGWPIGKYRNVVVPSFSLYKQTDRFDINGKIIKGVPGTGFTSYSGSVYFGYGISRRLDVIGNIPYYYQQNKLGAGHTITNQGAGDAILGLSYNLVNFNYLQFLSVQVSGIAPLYNKSNASADLGYGSFGTEVKLMYTGNLAKSIARKGYFNIEVAYRKYFDTQGPDQVSVDGTLGFPINKHNQFSIEVLVFKSISSNKTFNNNINSARDYDFFKPALNYGHQFSRRFSFFLGGFYVPFGRNTGVGYGGSALAVLKL